MNHIGKGQIINVSYRRQRIEFISVVESPIPSVNRRIEVISKQKRVSHLSRWLRSSQWGNQRCGTEADWCRRCRPTWLRRSPAGRRRPRPSRVSQQLLLANLNMPRIQTAKLALAQFRVKSLRHRFADGPRVHFSTWSKSFQQHHPRPLPPVACCSTGKPGTVS